MERAGRRIYSNMESDLKVLMISSDRNVATPGSPVSLRMEEYGKLVEELHIVLLSDKSHGIKEVKLGENVYIYPTNSALNLLRPIDAVRIGKKLVFEKKFVRGKSLITAQDMECAWAGLKVKRKWRIPLEVQMHTDISSPYFSGFQNKVRKFFAKNILKNADSVRDVRTLPIYVEKEKIENAPVKFDLHTKYGWKFIMLTVSRLSPEKNLGLALEVLSEVRKKYPETGLVIVGSGPDENRLKILIKKLNLQGFVEFAGWQEELGSFYKTSNAFIQTSAFEGYGLSLVEAGLSLLPVLTTAVGIAKELQNGKDIYICNTKEEFAQRITELIEDNSKRENLKINLKNYLESKLLSKADYMAQIKANWEKTANLLTSNS